MRRSWVFGILALAIQLCVVAFAFLLGLSFPSLAGWVMANVIAIVGFVAVVALIPRRRGVAALLVPVVSAGAVALVLLVSVRLDSRASCPDDVREAIGELRPLAGAAVELRGVQGSCLGTFSTDQSFEVVADHYRAELSRLGWSIGPHSPSAGVLEAERDGIVIEVSGEVGLPVATGVPDGASVAGDPDGAAAPDGGMAAEAAGGEMVVIVSARRGTLNLASCSEDEVAAASALVPPPPFPALPPRGEPDDVCVVRLAVPGRSVDDVVEHYRAQLADQGWTITVDAGAGTDPRVLAATRGGLTIDLVVETYSGEVSVDLSVSGG